MAETAGKARDRNVNPVAIPARKPDHESRWAVLSAETIGGVHEWYVRHGLAKKVSA